MPQQTLSPKVSLSKKIRGAFYNLPPVRHFLYKKDKQKVTALIRQGNPFDRSSFYRLNIGCAGEKFIGFINLDCRQTKKGVFVLPFHDLPFPDQSVKAIHLNFRALQKCSAPPRDFIPEFGRVLVSGGTLVIENLIAHGNSNLTGLLNESLAANSFSPVPGDSRFAVTRKTYLLNVRPVAATSFDEIKKANTRQMLLEWSGLTSFEPVLEDILASHHNLLLLSGTLSHDGRDLMLHAFADKPGETADLVLFWQVLEHVDNVYHLLDEIHHLYRAHHARHFFMVKNEACVANGRFFDKGTLAEAIDLSGLSLETISLLDDGSKQATLDRYGEIPFLLAEASLHPVRRTVSHISAAKQFSQRKIITIGEYSLLKNVILGFHQDGILRALKDLDMPTHLIDFRRTRDYGEILRQIREFKPEFLLLCLKDCLPMIKELHSQIKPLGTKILYWFCDAEFHAPIDLKNEIDFMFLSNEGQIPDYRKLYGVENIFYMPQGFDPAIHFDRKLNRVYDIGFSGSVDNSSLHKRRTRLVEELKKRYTVKIVNNIRNHISRFYSQSRMIFGISDFEYELYVSNRFFITLGCGAVNLTYRFPGMERLARDGEHVVSFGEDAELFSKIDHYLKHPEALEKIRINAKKLADSRHTYTHRLKNILDIVDGKSRGFEGFLT